MEALENICACLPEEISRAVRERADSLTELRLRPGGRPQLCFAGSDALLKAPLAPAAFREVAARMLEHSLYAWEDELKQGFFTLPGGSRVGVCGRYALEDGRIGALTYISALCVRVSREVRGAGKGLAAAMLENGGLKSALLISRPGIYRDIYEIQMSSDDRLLLEEEAAKNGI